MTTYLAPQFTGNANLTATVSALFDNSHDVRTFAAQRWEGSMQLSQRLSRANSLQYRLSYRRVSVKDLKISPQLIPLLSQPDRVTQFSMSFIQDRRDDPVDTHHGIYNTVDAGVSLPVLGTSTDFTRLLLRKHGVVDFVGNSDAAGLGKRLGVLLAQERAPDADGSAAAEWSVALDAGEHLAEHGVEELRLEIDRGGARLAL